MNKGLYMAAVLLLAGAGCAGSGTAGVNSTGDPSSDVQVSGQADLGDIAVRNGELVYELMLAGGELKSSWEADLDAATNAAGNGDYQEAARLMMQVNAEIEAEIESLK